MRGGATYGYEVRAVAGSPVVESPASGELTATTIARPAAPAGAVTAAAGPGGRIDVGWTAVPATVGYDVYRRTTGGTFTPGSPLNGSTPVTGVTYADLTAVDATTYVYVVRAVILGAGGVPVDSGDSAESTATTADAVAPPAPTAASVTGGGNVLAAASCGVASGTRYVNAAGRAGVPVTVTIAAPESGETVLVTATTPSSTPVTRTVAATGTTVATTIDTTTLLDGTLTLTARTADRAGNVSAARTPVNPVVKDTVAPTVTALAYTNITLFADKLSGTAECGATILATETTGPHVGNTYTTSIASGSTFANLTVDAISLGGYAYDVTATDLAGNAGSAAAAAISGSDLL